MGPNSAVRGAPSQSQQGRESPEMAGLKVNRRMPGPAETNSRRSPSVNGVSFSARGSWVPLRASAARQFQTLSMPKPACMICMQSHRSAKERWL